MKITRSGLPTSKGSAEWFTGDVYVDSLAVAEGESLVSGGIVHFTPGARTAWHTHPYGQTIYVLEGVGRCQRKGGPVEEIRPGDRVFFEPNEDHWHGATADRFMTHVAVWQTDSQGVGVVWGEHVSDSEYSS